MREEEAGRILAGGDDPDEPADLPASVLSKLNIDDVPDGAVVQIGTLEDGVLHLDWSGKIGRDESVVR